MAYEQNPYAVKISLIADASGATASPVNGGSVSLQKQFYFVKLATASTTNYNPTGVVATAVSAPADRAIGVLQNNPRVYFDAQGNVEGVSEAEVTVSGVTKVVAGASFAAGSIITSGTDGRAVALVAGATAATTAYILGTALTPASAANDVVTVVINASAAGRGA